MNGHTMQRRSFITLLGASAAAWPLTAGAQQRALPVVGLLSATSPEGDAQSVSRIRAGLAETGFVEARNVAIEYRYANSQIDHLPALAADLVRRQVSVIVAISANPALAAKAATTTIPTVFSIGGDAVEQLGLVASYNRPGGNMTGVTAYSNELWSKRVEQMRELVPSATVIGILVNPNNPGTERATRGARDAGRVLGRQILILNANTDAEIDAAFASLVQQRAGAVLVQGEPFLISRRDQIIALAARHSIPASYPNPADSFAGGLISYGTSQANRADLDRQLGVYTGRILKGEKPADLPVIQPTRFELVINLKTAKALGLTIPPGVLAIVDEVIE